MDLYRPTAPQSDTDTTVVEACNNQQMSEGGNERAWQIIGYKSRTYTLNALEETCITIFKLIPLACGFISLPPISCHGWLYDEETSSSSDEATAVPVEVPIGGSVWAFNDFKVFVKPPIPNKTRVTELYHPQDNIPTQ